MASRAESDTLRGFHHDQPRTAGMGCIWPPLGWLDQLELQEPASSDHAPRRRSSVASVTLNNLFHSRHGLQSASDLAWDDEVFEQGHPTSMSTTLGCGK